MAQQLELTPEMQQCIDRCLQCYAACMKMSLHCLGMGGEHASVEHQRILADCAQACIACTGFMLRGSRYHAGYCRNCAEVCQACGDSCERLAGGDEVMTKCVEACRKCEETCRQMAAGA